MSLELDRIYNMDCLEGLKQLEDSTIDIIFTSPPYNKAGHEGFIRKPHKKDSWSRRNIDYENNATNDFMDEKAYQKWQIDVLNECWRVLKEDGNIFYNHKTRIAQHKATHPLQWILLTKLIFRQQLIWEREATPQISPIRFLPTTEYIFWLTKKPIQPLFNRIDNTSEVIKIKPDKKSNHPAPFPEELVTTILKHCNGNMVLDPFMGSGTTAISCKLLGKHFIGFEISKEYCNIANKRLNNIPERLDNWLEVRKVKIK
jgi:site-specific DNA-methyltransferase (adenine-specific)